MTLMAPLHSNVGLITGRCMTSGGGGPNILVLDRVTNTTVRVASTLLVGPGSARRVGRTVYQTLRVPRRRRLGHLRRVRGVVSMRAIGG